MQLAGLGTSQALWSTITVFTSFAWGTLVFQEPVAHPIAAAVGLSVMAIGVLGVGCAMQHPGPPADASALASAPDDTHTGRLHVRIAMPIIHADSGNDHTVIHSTGREPGRTLLLPTTVALSSANSPVRPRTHAAAAASKDARTGDARCHAQEAVAARGQTADHSDSCVQMPDSDSGQLDEKMDQVPFQVASCGDAKRLFDSADADLAIQAPHVEALEAVQCGSSLSDQGLDAQPGMLPSLVMSHRIFMRS